jgi:hypothetical protein
LILPVTVRPDEIAAFAAECGSLMPHHRAKASGDDLWRAHLARFAVLAGASDPNNRKRRSFFRP